MASPTNWEKALDGAFAEYCVMCFIDNFISEVSLAISEMKAAAQTHDPVFSVI